MLEEQLKALAEYEVDFKYQKDWFVVGVTFNPQWVIVEPVNTLIEYMEKNGRYYYGAPVDSIKVEDIFNCINETIEYNKDIERKMELFNRKVDELQELFANEIYEDLLTLEFKFKQKRQPKNVTSKKSKSENSTSANTRKKKKNDIENSVTTDTVDDSLINDGIMFVDTIAEAYKEEERKKNKNII